MNCSEIKKSSLYWVYLEAKNIKQTSSAYFLFCVVGSCSSFNHSWVRPPQRSPWWFFRAHSRPWWCGRLGDTRWCPALVPFLTWVNGKLWFKAEPFQTPWVFLLNFTAWWPWEDFYNCFFSVMASWDKNKTRSSLFWLWNRLRHSTCCPSPAAAVLLHSGKTFPNWTKNWWGRSKLWELQGRASTGLFHQKNLQLPTSSRSFSLSNCLKFPQS